MPCRVPALVWTLGEPVEKVILENEEKSTSYTETGDTGLLLGTVKLPAPKNHFCVGWIILRSSESHVESEATYTLMCNIWDGVAESGVSTNGFTNVSYQFFVGSELDTYVASTSIKGNSNLELRFYLVGDVTHPDTRAYCRNLVVTVMPLYKTWN